MILSVGMRSDVIRYYSPWLFHRFACGFVYTRNPLFPHRVTNYVLSPNKVDAVVFRSQDYSPALPRLREITDRYRTYFQYVITGYGADLEPNGRTIGESIKTLKELSRIVGREKIVWRFEPVLLTERYTIERQTETFARIASLVFPYVGRFGFSFAEYNLKLHDMLPRLSPMGAEEKRRLAQGFGAVAKKYGIALQTCGKSERNEYAAFGILSSGCVTLDDIGQANGCLFRSVKHFGNKMNCCCIRQRDVGWYEACPGLCRYCTGNADGALVLKNYSQHDPLSPIMIGKIEETDVLFQGVQNSNLKIDGKQISFFDF